ncbi:YVTN family beta-propeller protein [Catenulispora sp. EB89]|uniref:IPT/TIG domain-containing protein n=1 Tax=Catenulispora sp. EB89 TaxID=3156257 RepID=UPI0035148C68
MVLPKFRSAWRRSTSAVCAFALAVAGLVGVVTAAPARATTAMDLAYVLNSGSGTDGVNVVDVATSTIVGTIRLGDSPRRVVTSPDRRTAYVLGYDGSVSVIDAGTSTVTHTISACGEPGAAAMKPDGSQLWVGCGFTGIVVIDTATATVTKTISMRADVSGLTFAADGSTVYASYFVFSTGTPGIEAIDSATGAVTAGIDDENYSLGLVLSPDAATLLVSQQHSDSVAVVDTASSTVAATIPMGGSPDGGVLNPDGTAVYYCVNGTDIEVVDLASRSITRTLALPCGDPTYTAGSLAFAPDGNTLYAILGRTGGVSVIDVPTGTVTATIQPGVALDNPVAAAAFVRAALVPTVTAVSPAQGSEAGGKVVIYGGPFSGGGGVTAVSFGGVPATSFTIDSDSQITAFAPPQTFRTVAVTVTNDNGTSAAGPAGGYTYLQAAPAISALTPNSGVSSGGTTVVITGTDLSITKSVYFGGTAASSFTVDSPTQVTAVTRAQTNGTVNVSVTNAIGVSTSVPSSQFTFFSPVPVVTAVSPATGPTAGGSTVTITGIRFTGTFRVAFGGVAVPYTLKSDSTITVVTPAWSSTMAPAAGTSGSSQPGGVVDVTVTTDVDTSAISAADQYIYVAPA